MAKLQTICYCAFLLAVIACHETLFTEGRDLKSKEASPPVENTQNLGFGSSVAVLKDDFRPTTPGNNPGVGHAFTGHHDIDTKPKALENAPGVGHSVAGNTDDFRPTRTGNSPGEGHDDIDDFRPTTSGNSPGVGHAFAGHHDSDTKPKALENAPRVGYSFQTKIAEPNP